jgi:hypothetical protein
VPLYIHASPDVARFYAFNSHTGLELQNGRRKMKIQANDKTDEAVNT